MERREFIYFWMYSLRTSILLHTKKVTWKSSNEFPYVRIAINHFLPHSLQEIVSVIFLRNNYKLNNISNGKLVLTWKKKVISILRKPRTRWKVYRFFLSIFFISRFYDIEISMLFGHDRGHAAVKIPFNGRDTFHR